jgi:hypothetical protein
VGNRHGNLFPKTFCDAAHSCQIVRVAQPGDSNANRLGFTEPGVNRAQMHSKLVIRKEPQICRAEFEAIVNATCAAGEDCNGPRSPGFNSQEWDLGCWHRFIISTSETVARRQKVPWPPDGLGSTWRAYCL